MRGKKSHTFTADLADFGIITYFFLKNPLIPAFQKYLPLAM